MLVALAFVEAAQDTDLVVFVFVEIESVFLPIFQLQEVVVKRFLRNADFVRCHLQRYLLVIVQTAPLAHFDHDLADFTLFFASRDLLLLLTEEDGVW